MSSSRQTEQRDDTLPTAHPDDVQLFWELASELFCVLDNEGKILEVNPAWTRVLGWDAEQLLGHNIYEFVHPEDIPGAREAHVRRGGDGQRLEEYPCRYRHADGSVRWLSWSGFMRGPRFYGSARDITATRMSHSALQQSERRSRAILAALREGLVIIDRQGRVVEANDRFAEMVGIPVREMLGLRPPYPWWPSDQRRKIAGALDEITREEQVTHELTFVRADGERFPVLIDTSRMRERDGRTVSLSVIRDISELVTTRNRLQEAHRVAELSTWEWYPDRDLVIAFETATGPGGTVEMTGEQSLMHLRPEWRDEVRRLREETYEGLRETFVADAVTLDLGWMQIRGEQMRAADGRITGLRGTAQRIDAQRSAEIEAALQRDVLDAIDVAFIARGPDTRLVHVNDAALRLFGFSREEILGTLPAETGILQAEDPAMHELLAATQRGEQWDGEMQLRRKDGSTLRARVRTTVLVREGGAQYSAGIIVPL